MEFRVTGYKEINKALTKLPARAAKRSVKSAIRAAGRMIIKKARSNLGGRYKTLKKSLGIKVLKGSEKTTIALIGARVGKKLKNDGWYAHIVEFGASPHLIKSKKSQSKDGEYFGKVVHHPGIKPNPFLRPALDSEASRAVEAFGEQIWKQIKKEMARK